MSATSSAASSSIRTVEDVIKRWEQDAAPEMSGSMLSKLKSAPSAEDLQSNLQARIHASTGDNTKSSYKSALRQWGRFCDLPHKQLAHFPPKSRDVEEWLALANTKQTAISYKSALAKATRLAGYGVYWDEARLADIVKGIQSKQGPSNAKMPIYPDLLTQMVQRSCDQELNILMCTCFMFLLRLKDEGMPLCRGLSTDRPETTLVDRHSSVFLYMGELVILLKKRKNKKTGDILRRGCCCGKIPCGSVPEGAKRAWSSYCPVHVIWPFIMKRRVGEAVFPSLRYNNVLQRMKSLAKECGEDGNIGSQGLRKGAANSITACGGDLADLLEAGHWSSRAFMSYIDKQRIMGRVLFEKVAVEMSDSDD